MPPIPRPRPSPATLEELGATAVRGRESESKGRVVMRLADSRAFPWQTLRSCAMEYPLS